MVKFGYFDLEYSRVSESDVQSQLEPAPPYWPGVKVFYIIAHGGYNLMEVDPITRAVPCPPPEDDRGRGTYIYTSDFTQWMSSRGPVKVAVLINCNAMGYTGSGSINYALRRGQTTGTCAYGLRHFDESGIPMHIERDWEKTIFQYAYDYPERSVYSAYIFAVWAFLPGYDFATYSGFVGDVSVKFWV